MKWPSLDTILFAVAAAVIVVFALYMAVKDDAVPSTSYFKGVSIPKEHA